MDITLEAARGAILATEKTVKPKRMVNLAT